MKKILLTSALAVAVAGPAFAAPGDMMIRARGLGVIPQESSTLSIGGHVKVDNNITPELDFTYFFTPNVAVEAIAAVSKHNVKTDGGTNAGSVWLLPPTVTLQYHLTSFQSFKPYVGAGLNYTHFYNAKGGDLNHVNYDDSFGAAFQAGVDVPLGGNWYANADVKKLFISTSAKFSPSGVRADVDIDPLLVGVGIGYRF